MAASKTAPRRGCTDAPPTPGTGPDLAALRRQGRQGAQRAGSTLHTNPPHTRMHADGNEACEAHWKFRVVVGNCS